MLLRTSLKSVEASRYMHTLYFLSTWCGLGWVTPGGARATLGSVLKDHSFLLAVLQGPYVVPGIHCT